MVFLLVGQALEALKGLVQFGLAQRIAQLVESRLERVAARVLAQHQPALRHADRLRPHDLVGLLVLEHAVLMDAGFVRKGVRADDGLVRLDDDAGVVADQLAGVHDLRRVNAGDEVEDRAARVQRHHDFFERGVARALADAVDRDFGLARARADARQRVGRRQAQIVVAVNRDDAVFDAGRVLHDAGDERAKLVGRGVADRVRDVERGGPGLDRFAQHQVQKLRLAAPGVFRAELDVLAQAARIAHHLDTLLHHLLAVHLELVFHVNLGRGEEGVDARAGRVLDGLPGFVNVVLGGARQAADDGRTRRRRSSGWPCPPQARCGARLRGRRARRPESRPRSRPRRAARACAPLRAFRREVMVAPGDCSPSRSVVSKMRT